MQRRYRIYERIRQGVWRHVCDSHRRHAALDLACSLAEYNGTDHRVTTAKGREVGVYLGGPQHEPIRE